MFIESKVQNLQPNLLWSYNVPFSIIPIIPSRQTSSSCVFSLLGRQIYWLFPYISLPHQSLSFAERTSSISVGHTTSLWSIPLKTYILLYRKHVKIFVKLFMYHNSIYFTVYLFWFFTLFFNKKWVTENILSLASLQSSHTFHRTCVR